MSPSTQPIPQTFPPKVIAYAKRNDLILCDKHIFDRLQELYIEHFEILGDGTTLPCCRCGEPGLILDLPFLKLSR